MQEMVIYGVSFDMVGKQPIVLLKTVNGNKFLPIWIGHPEAASILMKLQGAGTPRPMTHDLLCDLLGELDARCTQVAVTELRENTFFASITISAGGRELEIDSRPSDAIALAVRSGAPIFAAEEVIAESAIEFEHDVEESEDVVEKFKEFLDHVTPEDFRRRAGGGQALPSTPPGGAAGRSRPLEEPALGPRRERARQVATTGRSRSRRRRRPAAAGLQPGEGRPSSTPAVWGSAPGRQSRPYWRRSALGASARKRARQDPLDELVEADARGVGGLRQQARFGHAGHDVGLEHRELAGALLQHQVHAGDAVAAEQPVHLERQLLRALSCLCVELGGADERRHADLVARLEVVELLFARHGLHDRQRHRLSAPGEAPLGVSSTDTARSRPRT